MLEILHLKEALAKHPQLRKLQIVLDCKDKGIKMAAMSEERYSREILL